jgi:DNA-binding IclR family transcriptional regulator
MLGSAAGLVYLAALEEEPLHKYLDQLTTEGAERRAARRRRRWRGRERAAAFRGRRKPAA